MDDEGEGESDAAELPPSKINAEDNPWYLLATLYGKPEPPDYKLLDLLQGVPKDELREKNRAAWNRYFAANLDEETRTRLIREQRHLAEELTPLSPEQLLELEEDFDKRRPLATTLVLPPPNSLVNFSDVQFDHSVYFAEFLFTRVAFFTGAVFSGIGNSFHGATFCGGAVSDRAIFKGSAWFREATFSGGASFNNVTFSRGSLI
jgi:hypothetical protein